MHAVPSYIPHTGSWERAGGARGTGDPNFWSFQLQKGSQESYSERINNSRTFFD